MIEKSRRVKGCWDQTVKPIARIGDISFTKCVGNYHAPIVLKYLEMYHAYEKGILPYRGSLSEQPNKILEIFGVITTHKHEKMIKEQKRQALRDKQTRLKARRGK